MAESKPIRWGIISTGGIAGAFAHALQFVEGTELLGVGSRSQDSADRFGEKYNIPRRYPTYQALAEDPDIDAIYVATPHPMHYEDTLLCLNNGKAVLCEKVFAMTAAEANEMIAAARANNVFLMEAMWTRWLPRVVEIRRLLSERVLGEVRFFQADFGVWFQFDPNHRVFAPELGGSALLDLGIYPVSFASMVFGMQPEKVVSLAHMGQTGVDEFSGITFSYPNEGIAQIYTASQLQTPHEALIVGDKGMIRIPGRFYAADSGKFTLQMKGEAPQEFDFPVEDSGYRYEAEEVVRCMREGLMESPVLPLSETLAIMQTMDRIQAAWGTARTDTTHGWNT
jgi:dihydrodiol dehydrogenase / D-xylose 1-dehydrogenase (NADP)